MAPAPNRCGSGSRASNPGLNVPQPRVQFFPGSWGAGKTISRRHRVAAFGQFHHLTGQGLSLLIQQGLGGQGRLIQGPLGPAAGVAGLPRFAFAPACFFPVFSGGLKPGLPTPGAKRSSLNWGSISQIQSIRDRDPFSLNFAPRTSAYPRRRLVVYQGASPGVQHSQHIS